MGKLITRAEAKTYAGVTVTTYDTEVDAFIEAVTIALEKFLGRDLIGAASTIQLDGTGTRYLWLPQQYATVTAIYQDSAREFAASSLVTAADYYHSEDTEVVDYHTKVWTSGWRNCKVVGTVGYATIPEPLKQAARVAFGDFYSRWQRAKEGRDVIGSEGLEGWTQKLIGAEDLPAAAKALADLYRPARL